MSNKLTLLKCPQCGSNQIEAVGDDKFQCQSCKSFFMYDSNRIYNITNNTYHSPGGYAQTPGQKKVILLVPVLLVAFVFIFVMVLTTHRHTSLSAVTTEDPVAERIQAATAVLTATGPQIWKLSALQTGDTYRYVFIKEDAASRKRLSLDTLSGKLDWTAYRENPYDGSLLLSYGKYCFHIYDGGAKVKAYNTYNGQLAWDEKTFPKRFPEFKSQLVEIKENFDTRFRNFFINAANGIKYSYYADGDTVMTDEAFENKSFMKEYTWDLKDTVFFSFAEKSDENSKYYSLYRIHKIASLKDPQNGIFFEDDYARNLGDAGERKAHRILDFNELTPNIRYFRPHLVYQDGKRTVVAYNTDANENGPLLVSLIEADGTVRFTTGGKETEPLKTLTSTGREAICYQDKLFFYEQGDHVEVVVLNLQTGKIDLHYKQED